MVYVTGDMHGDMTRLSPVALRPLKKGDTLLVCGDFGAGGRTQNRENGCAILYTYVLGGLDNRHFAGQNRT